MTMRCSTPASLSARFRSASCATSLRRCGLQPPNKFPNFGRGVLALEGHCEIGGDKARGIPAIVTRRFDLQCMERLLADQLGHCIGELDLSAGAALLPIEHAHHLGL